MTPEETMREKLAALTEADETLRCPVFGHLLQKGRSWTGYFALAENALLVWLLPKKEGGKGFSARVPLELKSVRVIRLPLRGHVYLRLRFRAGNPCRLLLPMRAYALEKQTENVKIMIETLKKRCGKR